jgi:hypothetical protein
MVAASAGPVVDGKSLSQCWHITLVMRFINMWDVVHCGCDPILQCRTCIAGWVGGH